MKWCYREARPSHLVSSQLSMQKRPSTNARQLAGTANTEVYHTNAVADSLISPAWPLLLSRIGDTLMLYLLLHCSMFTRVENDCCFQLTGLPAVRRAREWRKLSEVPFVSDKETKPARKTVNVANRSCGIPPREKVIGRKRKRLAEGVGFTQERSSACMEGHHAEMSDALQKSLVVPSDNAHANAEKQEAKVVANSSKTKVRPSSWQRRNNRTSTVGEQPSAAPNGPENLEASIPSTQPLSEASKELQGPLKADYGYTQWPRYMPKPTEMHIGRAPIFYCATFPPRPGFAAKRESTLSHPGALTLRPSS